MIVIRLLFNLRLHTSIDKLLCLKFQNIELNDVKMYGSLPYAVVQNNMTLKCMYIVAS